MIEPDIASDMAQSLVNDYQQGGAFPRWGVPNDDSGVMIGDPSAAIIADFIISAQKISIPQQRWLVYYGRLRTQQLSQSEIMFMSAMHYQLI